MVCRDKKDLWDGRVRISIRTTSLSLIKLQGFVRVATTWGAGFQSAPTPNADRMIQFFIPLASYSLPSQEREPF